MIQDKTRRFFKIDVILVIIASISAFFMVKASDDYLPSSLNKTCIGRAILQFENGNQLIFNLAVGMLVGLFVYVLVSRLPERQKRIRIRNHLLRQYEAFRYETIRILVSAQGATYAGNLIEELMDKKSFRQYFETKVSESETRWSRVVNNFNDYCFRELSVEFDILISEILLAVHTIDIETEKVFSQINHIRHVSMYVKSLGQEYDDRKTLFRYLWSVNSGFSFEHGYAHPDIIEEAILAI
ncbi:hypothetical protein GeomeDRAFT_2390 [Geobacter metallireducens RCH3]|uniref:Uncharacterized protein n=1 Tax=Geobacter metallireducens (strain ATCC 53774 / DSM 7210 / GS-15) TaxID=269799 RepID=Q39WM0_GEOMG|nr:hypothetical protein [Geobacter metallireducens]ABB31354.1 hypothetical protein Gmet_1114 [Geobacter metallireducens GS-15]EHP85680.1 hypothetical protein GeomeDRAFT_2390 [Geobacter metallireducens RCH3]